MSSDAIARIPQDQTAPVANLIEERCATISAEVKALAATVGFRASFALGAGQLTMSHVYLHAAKQAAIRLLADIDLVAAEADAYVKVPA